MPVWHYSGWSDRFQAGRITTEIIASGPFYYAEHFHQQYLAKVPNGYCGLGGTGVGCDISPLATMDITSAG